MGRPLAKRFFGNTNEGGTGGEGVASVAAGTAGSAYSQGLTATVSVPQIAGGVTALVSPTVDSVTGGVTGYVATNQGSGYLSAPLVVLVKPAVQTATATGNIAESTIVCSGVTGVFKGMAVAGTGIGVGAVVVSVVNSTKVVTLSVPNSGAVSGVVTFTDVGTLAVPGAATLTGTRPNAISMTAITVLAGTARANSDVVQQKGSRRYKLRNQDGVAVCRLFARAPVAVGEASLVATDSSGKTYYVTKLTRHKALLTQFGAAGWEFASDTDVEWTLGAAVLHVSVSVASV